jgi:murein DD-endopeptidase MepM/ murein hydrolase activator NlpD
MPGTSKLRGATAFDARPPFFASRPVLIAIALACAVAVATFWPILRGKTVPGGERAETLSVTEVQPPAAASTLSQTLIEATTPLQPEISPAPKVPTWDERKVQRGDSLTGIFKRAGFTERHAYSLLSQAPEGKALSRIHPGEVIAFLVDESGELAAVRHVKSRLETTEYRSNDTGFSTEKILFEPEIRETWASAEISSSLFLAGQRAGLSQNVIMKMAGIFGGVIDFVLDPRAGDSIHVIYQELYLDGEKYQDGDILAASYTSRDTTFNAFRYQDSNGDIGYYNEQGVSMRKAFLMAPVDFTRISSNFNPRRLHPIYKTTRPHRGIDYAAPRGTPVFAAGNGKVIKTGYSKSNGNYIFIRHGQDIVTRYLHLHKRLVKTGQRVTQSQIIGRVGATGAATGPHLHYEFLINGVHRNPRTIHKKLPKARSLASAELPAFEAAIKRASTQLAALRSENNLALNQMNEPTGVEP